MPHLSLKLVSMKVDLWYVDCLWAYASVSPWVALEESIATDIQRHKPRRGSAENELFIFHDSKM